MDDKKFREKIQRYLDNYSKRQLAMLLVMRDEGKDENGPASAPVTQPAPFRDDNMWHDPYHRCKTWEDCTNPHYDCINCPMRSIPPQPNIRLTNSPLGVLPTTISCVTYTETSRKNDRK